MPRIAVVGGGIAGLAAAFRTVELCPDVDLTLFEASPRLGGVLHTERVDGYQIEHGSDSFITNRPGAIELCQRLGMADQLLRTDDRFRRTFVVHRGRLRDVPEGFLLMAPTKIWSVLTSPVLSLAGKARLAWEYFVPARPAAAGDESLASFVRRRLGREAFERLVQPLVGGIYTADAEQLSLAATLPRFLEMERQHGGLIRAARKEAASQAAKNSEGKNGGPRQSGARYSLFVTPRDGLSSLVEAIVARLPPGAVRLGTPVSKVVRGEQGWEVQVANPDSGSQTFDGAIVATPAPVASRQLQPLDAELAASLAGIPYAGAAVVSLGYDRRQIGHALDGFGFVVPEVEGLRILACSFSSVKFAGRAPEGKALLRVFIGGAKRPDLVTLSDAELAQIVASELTPLLSLTGEPELVRVGRYPGAMPQYHVGHLDRVATIEAQAARHAGLELCGNAYRGVGIPDTTTSGEAAAERLIRQLVG